MYDFIVIQLKEIPRPEYRDVATIRGRLVDQNGKLIPGAYFQIRSDSVPQFVAVEPHGSAPTDGTATFAVTRGRFAVRVLGGRSEDAGWMVTGTGTFGPMSDFEFTFQATAPNVSQYLVSPTPTWTATSVPTSTWTATPVPTVTWTPTPAPTATWTPTTQPTSTKTPTPVPPMATSTPVPRVQVTAKVAQVASSPTTIPLKSSQATPVIQAVAPSVVASPTRSPSSTR